MSGDNGKLVEDLKQDQSEGQVSTDQQGHLAKIKVGDQEFKVTNSAEMIGIWVHKLENGKEVSQVVAHEFMMTDHKAYMIRLLTDAINTVARAKKREPMIKLASEAMFNRLRRSRIKDIFRGRK